MAVIATVVFTMTFLAIVAVIVKEIFITLIVIMKGDESKDHITEYVKDISSTLS